MRYRSTSGRAAAVTLRRALLDGLAPDGGLYLPESIPDLAPTVRAAQAAGDLAATAAALLAPYADPDLAPDELAVLVADALNFPIPLVQLEDDLWLVELFHGPTLAFKDVAARTLARLMARLADPGRPLTVLVATSGDTGSAVASAFLGIPGTRVVVLFPAGRVSSLQERQFSTLGGNVRAVEVAGAFDDCQRLARGALSDRELARSCGLTSANSINIGRLLPQMSYFVHGLGQLPPGPPPLVCVPSGNFGNLTAGLMAHRAGLEIAGFVAATNANDVVPRYLESGRYEPRPALATISNAMDVGDPSNLARIRDLFGGDLAALRAVVSSSRHDDVATRRAIQDVHQRTGVVLDPHTAVGYLALRARLDASPGSLRGVLLATAHPAKFGETVAPVLGFEPELPERLAACLGRPRHVTGITADPMALRRLLLEEGSRNGGVPGRSSGC